MIGTFEVGEIRTRCEVVAVRNEQDGTYNSFRGRLSVPGYGTKFTDTYPDRNDAVASLVDLRREVYGAAMPESAMPEVLLLA